MRTAPLTPGEKLPTLELSHADGRAVLLETLVSTDRFALYFMRTPTCPVCHAHLRHIERATHGTGTLAENVIVVVPGDPSTAADVERRHPRFAGRVVASATAHASVGLFVRGGLQRSGTFVVDSTGTVVAARTSTIPISSYDEAEVKAALASAPA